MGGRKRGEVPAGLARARGRFEVWRSRRRPRSRIPESLWDLAVEQASAHGVSRTASTLRLDYYSLKERVASAADRQSGNGPAFIELPPSLPSGKECVIALEDDTGVRLRIHLKGYDATEVVTVGRSLRNGE